MKYFYLIISFLMVGASCTAQDNDSLYLKFESNSNEVCTIPKEQQGRYNGKTETKKYQKIIQDSGEIYFYICKELFVFNNKSKDVYNSSRLESIKFSEIKDVIKKANVSNPLYPNKAFDKIYIVEEISDKKIVKYVVKWQYYVE